MVFRGTELDQEARMCTDCGWTVRQGQLPPGKSLHTAFVDHGRFCAVPDPWGA